mmetsp:Transcript_44219/g.49574  ORF Transcript_44219/g.49574 Transcript_44219/m.49574 type:complete len:254 (-) Transcript_44219:434-1195(-)
MRSQVHLRPLVFAVVTPEQSVPSKHVEHLMIVAEKEYWILFLRDAVRVSLSFVIELRPETRRDRAAPVVAANEALDLPNDSAGYSIVPDECELEFLVDQRLLPSSATLPVLRVCPFVVFAILLFLPPILPFEFVELAAIGFASLVIVVAPHSIVVIVVVVQGVIDDALLSASFVLRRAVVVNSRAVALVFGFVHGTLDCLAVLVAPSETLLSVVALILTHLVENHKLVPRDFGYVRPLIEAFAPVLRVVVDMC